MTTMTNNATDLLKQLIATPSFSGEEKDTAGIIKQFLQDHGVTTQRHINNIWATNRHFDPSRPTLLLNSHHDTVRPNDGYTRDPFLPAIEDGKLYGLGSNDAGGPLVALIACFLHFYDQQNLNYNLLLAATAEEEISGENGIESLIPHLPDLECALVGEPTQMRMAVAEKGLMVLDCTASGVSGHAARDEGLNAIYEAISDIEWIRSYRFSKRSETLGEVKMSATMIEAGIQHNMVPDTCTFTIDVRSTDAYSNRELLEIIKDRLSAEVTPRSTRLNSSSIPMDHPLVHGGRELGLTAYGSPTLSDQSLLPVPSMKIGPGKSARSHSSNEYIRLEELEQGISTYIQLVKQIL